MGTALGQRIQALADDMLRVEEGTLYPALYRIEQCGWIESEWGTSENNRRARFYRLTRAGKKQLGIEETRWSHLTDAIARVMQATDRLSGETSWVNCVSFEIGCARSGSRTAVHDDIADEFRFHMEMRARENERRGMSAADAQRDAEHRFGSAARNS
jgi:transcriptional regulator